MKTWYSNGVMESQREINVNKKQGLSFAWYKNGDLMLMEEYENDMLIKGSYFKKGDKAPISRIESGKGLATLYTSDGIFLRKVSYEKGKPKLDEEF
jgi:antitoxin component YwqK of YwqJK toxin-antitoxin module